MNHLTNLYKHKCEQLQEQITAYAIAIINKLNYIGVLAIEFFITKDNQIIANAGITSIDSSLVLNYYEVNNDTFTWSNNSGQSNQIRVTRIGNMCTITQTNTWTIYGSPSNIVHSVFSNTTFYQPVRFRPSCSHIYLYIPVTCKQVTTGSTDLYSPAYIRINTNGTMYALYSTDRSTLNEGGVFIYPRFLFRGGATTISIILGTFSYHVT